jgi:hypothetical protein
VCAPVRVAPSELEGEKEGRQGQRDRGREGRQAMIGGTHPLKAKETGRNGPNGRSRTLAMTLFLKKMKRSVYGG